MTILSHIVVVCAYEILELNFKIISNYRVYYICKEAFWILGLRYDWIQAQ